MLSVRLPEPIERDLSTYCTQHDVTKSQVVQTALADWLTKAKARQPARRGKRSPDLPFLAPDDPIREFIGSVKGGPSTDDWMATTRGKDWNKP